MPKTAVVSGQHGHLWSHDSWRVLAAHGSILFTTVFVYVCAKSLGAESPPPILSVESSAAIAKGGSLVVAGFTLFGYDSFQRENQIRKENIDIFSIIGKLSDNLLNKYGLEPGEHSQLDLLILTIKYSARACISIRTRDLELMEQLEEVNKLMKSLLDHLQHYISTLPDSLDQLSPEHIDRELLFWQREPLNIKEDPHYNQLALR